MTINMYFSVDVETDGDCPGLSSMLSIGVVALHPQTLAHYGSFYRTLKRLPEAQPSTSTMEWWDQFPKQWAETRANTEDPAKAMNELHEWVTRQLGHFPGEKVIPVFVASPATFDFAFVYYYLCRFVGRSIFSHSGLDMKSFAMALLGGTFTDTKKGAIDAWKTTLPHTHNALEDAEEQADIFRKMMFWRKGMKLASDPFMCGVAQGIQNDTLSDDIDASKFWTQGGVPHPKPAEPKEEEE